MSRECLVPHIQIKVKFWIKLIDFAARQR